MKALITRTASAFAMTAVLLVASGFTTIADNNEGSVITVQASGGRLG